ncbi:MAG: TRAP transporter large permease subunit [Vicinamibacterales bacterium]
MAERGGHTVEEPQAEPDAAANASAARNAPPIARALHAVENVVGALSLSLMAALPLAEIAGPRLFGRGVPGSVGFVQNLTLWVTFIGAMIAAREGRHLALATGTLLPQGVRRVTSFLASAAGVVVAAVLAWSAIAVVRADAESTAALGFGIPQWIAETVMPVGFAVVAIRMWWQAGSIPAAPAETGGAASVRLPAWEAWTRRAVVLAILAVVYMMGGTAEQTVAAWRWPLIATVLIVTAAGAPIFVALGGLAVVLFYTDPGAGPVAVIASEAYQIVSSETLPTVPLFTLAGALLAEGGTPGRLVRLFRALAGWLPGGTAVGAVLVCAFFTTFTGASGVTILALGGLLLPVLIKDVYSPRFSLGAVTASGSIGLLFPPSLPVILFGIGARVRIDHLFAACLLPGLVLVSLVAAYSIREGMARGARWSRPQPAEIASAFREAKWEVLLPIVVFVSLFGGFATPVEAAAITVAYAFFIKVIVYRDVEFTRDLPRVLGESVLLVGGVLIILGCALGLTNYLIFAEVPARGAEWVQAMVGSRWTFLLLLNLFLLVVGCLMDIFSAIFVVLPLILPIANAYQVDPRHLGAIFLINLELGYLTPPVGMNLFLSSYRFNKSMYEVTRSILPFMAVQAVGVLLVTYLPVLSVGVARWWAGG